MGPRVGLIGQRADLVVEVTALVTAVGGEVSLPWAAAAAGPPGPGERGPLGRAEVVAGFDLMLVDALADGPTPAGTPVVVVCRSGEEDLARARGHELRAEAVVTLPDGVDWLGARLRPAAPAPPALAVVGAVGGVGATTVAIATAMADPEAVLVDLDPDGAGAGIPLGLESGTGVGWADLPETRGEIDPDSLTAALPRVLGHAVLAGPPSAGAISRVGPAVSSLRAGSAAVVLDLGRRDHFGVLGPDDVLVVVVPGSVGGVVGARRQIAGAGVARVVLAVRDGGWVPRAQVPGELGGLPAVTVPTLRRAAELAECGQLLSGSTMRSLRSLGDQIRALAA
jgi:hypothetical protein